MSERILLVDDESNWLRTLSGIFRDRGHEVRGASTVDEAFGILHEGWPTRVVTDGMNGGWERIWQEASGVGIPAVMFSGNQDINDRLTQLGLPHVGKFEFAMGRVSAEDLLNR